MLNEKTREYTINGETIELDINKVETDFGTYEVKLGTSEYLNNGSLAIQLIDAKEYEPFATLTVNIDEEGEVVDSMVGFYDPTLEDVEEYFDFEIAEIKEID